MPMTNIEPTQLKPNRTRKWIIAFFLIFGLACVGFGTNNILDTIARQENLGVTQAVIERTKVQRKRTGSTSTARKTYRVYFSFRTEDGHEEKSFSSVSKSKYAELDAGAPFEVFYDRANPSNNRLNLEEQPHRMAMMIIGMGLMCLFASYWMWRRSPKNSETAQN